jgi:1,4-alpha-glucan branching enzyme
VTGDARRAEAIAGGRDGDPFSFLGMHARAGAVYVRAFRPQAERLDVVDARDGTFSFALERIHPAGVFAGKLAEAAPFAYRLRERIGGWETELEDPYRFGPVLGEIDVWLLAEGRHLRLWEILGAHPAHREGIDGTTFAVWAPNARRVSVVGEFNAWDGRLHPMRFRSECGVWEIFVPFDLTGRAYKFEILGATGAPLPLKADPVALQAELRPHNASIVAAPSAHAWTDAAWLAERGARAGYERPISIYEVHLGSWRRTGEGARSFLTYEELADALIPYALELGFTHLELMPVMEHPLDASWGYQCTGLFAPTSRYGTPDGLRRFVDRAHAAGLGVILDWVPGHFPTDAHGLGTFDGTHLYEHADMRKGFHHQWGTYVYNLGRREVANFLIADALYWLDQFHVDGLRVDAVSSLLYLDYERGPGEWEPNERGDNENLEATAFLRRLNETLEADFPGTMRVAEEATSWLGVTGPVSSGGLGFTYKWNMGWMNDSLRLFARDPFYRGHNFEELTFGLTYAFDEHHVLPLSHDEVVHLKKSLLGRMPGDEDERFASLRLLYGYMFAHPGKKLLFMGDEFAQEGEWSEARSLDWYQLEDPRRQALLRLVRDLNRTYAERPALHACDDSWAGFTWLEADDRDRAVAAFVRRDPASGEFALAVLNLSGVGFAAYRVGTPQAGVYREILNTDAALYGGANRGNFGSVTSENEPAHGQPYSLELYVPPQTLLLLVPETLAVEPAPDDAA